MKPPALPNALGEDAIEALSALFEDVEDVLFWIKDRRLCILRCNQSFADRVKRPREAIVGKTDADFYFPEMARVFMDDDRRVMETGQAIRRKVELLTNRWGGVEWRSTTKLPIRDASGRVVAATGISRPLAEAPGQLPPEYRALSQTIDACRRHLADGVDVARMAQLAGMSLSTLTRRFREHLRISPGEFLAQLRLARACQLLGDSPLNVTEIAIECGYESPAAFSRAFRRQMGESPRQFQQRQRRSGLGEALSRSGEGS